MEDNKYTEEDLRKAFKAGIEQGRHIQASNYFDAPLDEDEFVKNINENKVVMGTKNGNKDLAIVWWESLNEKEHNSILREYGLFGHDQGVTQDEIIYIWCEERCPLSNTLVV